MTVRRGFLFAIPVLGALLLILTLIFTTSPQPSYKGRTLKQWTREYGKPEDHSQANQAIWAIRSNALPLLVNMMAEPDWSVALKRKVFLFRKKFHIAQNDPGPSAHPQEDAAQAIGALGPAAQPAVPGLIKTYERGPAKEALVLGTLARIGPGSSNALPIIIRGSLSKNRDTRINASAALASLKLEPRIQVPLFIQALRDDYDCVIMNTLSGLARFGTNAKPAVPVILPLLKQTNVHDYASQVLSVIDPEAAIAAGVWVPWAARGFK